MIFEDGREKMGERRWERGCEEKCGEDMWWLCNKLRISIALLLSIYCRKEVLGQKHPDTLPSMNNLALVLDNQY
jgi:hypothetical protein